MNDGKPADLARYRAAVKEFYGLDREPTDEEVRDEITALRRKANRGGLDDRSEALAARLDVI